MCKKCGLLNLKGATWFCILIQAVSSRESEDVVSLEEKLGRSLSKQEQSRIGVSKLRLFLEELLQKRYVLMKITLFCGQTMFLELIVWKIYAIQVHGQCPNDNSTS